MIKGGLGYLKFSKLFLTLFGISCFMGLGVNYVSAEVTGTVLDLNNTYYSKYDNSFTMMVNGYSLFLSQYVGAGKQVLMSAPGRSFMWLNLNGQISPYVGTASKYGTNWRSDGEGVPDDFLLCDEFNWSDTAPSNCTDLNYQSNSSVVSRIFQNMSKWYYGTFTQDWIAYPGYVGTLYCFSSSSLGKSVCFYGCTHPNCGSYGDSIGGVPPHRNLSNSQNFGTNLENINQTLLSAYPGYGNVNGGSQTVNGDYLFTGDVLTNSCTKQKALTRYGCQGYDTRMCFTSYENNTDIFDGNPVGAFAIPGKDVYALYSDTYRLRRGGATGDSFDDLEWFKYWRNTYDVYERNSGQINNPFIGVPVGLFTYFANVHTYALPYTSESILEFCALAVYTQDLSADYTGVAYNTVCSMSPIELVDCSLSNELGGDFFNQTGTVGVVGSSWDGITNRSGYHDKPGYNGIDYSELVNYQDGKSFENDFFNTLKDNFKYPDTNGSGPILPTYIIIALCGIILFRFISH